jgi:hypothetical protein
MSDIKQIVVNGDVSITKGGRRSRKKSGGGSTQGAIVQLQSTSSSSETSTAVNGVNPSKLAEVAEPLQGGAKKPDTKVSEGKTKVVLSAPKKKTQKVILSVAKAPIQKLIDSKSKTRKSSKKILFSLKHLRNKLNVAKTIKKHSEEKSLAEIKKMLEEAKLIKLGSKAPEGMIRQIYSDYMTLKHKAL